MRGAVGSRGTPVGLAPVPCWFPAFCGERIGTVVTPVSTEAVSPNGRRSIPCSKVERITGERLVVVV